MQSGPKVTLHCIVRMTIMTGLHIAGILSSFVHFLGISWLALLLLTMTSITGGGDKYRQRTRQIIINSRPIFKDVDDDDKMSGRDAVTSGDWIVSAKYKPALPANFHNWMGSGQSSDAAAAVVHRSMEITQWSSVCTQAQIHKWSSHTT